MSLVSTCPGLQSRVHNRCPCMFVEIIKENISSCSVSSWSTGAENASQGHPRGQELMGERPGAVRVQVQSCPTLFDPGTIQSMNSPGQDTGVGSLSLLQGISLTQRSNPGLLQYWWILYQLSHKGSPRILEWVAFPFSRGSS